MTTKRERQAAAARYERARRALDKNAMAEYAGGVCYQTAEFRELIRDVWQAEPGVPRWRRWMVRRQVRRGLIRWRQARGDAR